MTLTTCQICGRAIKLVGDRIAHHGYQQPWRQQGSGARTASCPGSKHLPYEISRHAIPSVRDSYENQRAATQAAADEMMTTPPDTFSVRRRYLRETITLTRPDNFDAERNLHLHLGGHRMSYQGEHAGRIRTFRFHAKMLTEAIKFLDERYANWKIPA